jgi:hypothetical protein
VYQGSGMRVCILRIHQSSLMRGNLIRMLQSSCLREPRATMLARHLELLAPLHPLEARCLSRRNTRRHRLVAEVRHGTLHDRARSETGGLAGHLKCICRGAARACLRGNYTPQQAIPRQ